MIRVLLVDDQPLIRLGFGAILGSEEEIEVVGEAEDGRAAVERAAALDPDVICMDVQMPHMDGIEATRALVTAGSRAAILILTTFDRDDFLFETLAAGASGFLLKSAGPEELIDAVRVLGRGDALLDPQVTRRVLARVAAPPFGVTSPGSVVAESGQGDPGMPGAGQSETGLAGAGQGDPNPRQAGSARAAPLNATAEAGLTAREGEILALMARGMSNAEIAAELFVGESTVKTHVSNVLMKLPARDRVHAVIWAFEHGLTG